MQIDRSQESELKTRFIDTLNKNCAEGKADLALRFPQPSSTGDGGLVGLTWTEEKAKLYFKTGELPRDLTITNGNDKNVSLWVFDASTTGRSLPDEMELWPISDLAEMPAIGRFILNKEDNMAVAVAPSEYLRLEYVGGIKVRYVPDEQQQLSDFVLNLGELLQKVRKPK